MTNEHHHGHHAHGDYERRDIGVSGIVYFLVGLAIFLLASHFIVTALFHYLERRSEAEQPPVSPLATNAPADTRHLPTDYRDYLKQNFPTPQLEIDERTQLDTIRLNEEQMLSTYDYIDKNAGTVRIPIERAMDLIVQRGLPVRTQGGTSVADGHFTPSSESAKKEEKKKK